MGAVMDQGAATHERVLKAAAETALAGEVFERAAVKGPVLSCSARNAPDGVEYRIEIEEDGWYVSWKTPDRYLSQSIEADLMWTGDDLGEMVEEELAELGWEGESLGELEHFRSEEKLYTFRSRLPESMVALESRRCAEALSMCLHAYEAALRELGDMKEDEDAAG